MIKKISTILLASLLVLSGCSSKGEVVSGTYEYDLYGHTYSARVNVRVLEGVIEEITIEADDEEHINVSAVNDVMGWTLEDVNNWLDNQEAFLDSFVGLSVEDVNAISVSVSDGGSPISIDTYADAITGATQSSGRVILAVQDALANLE